MSDFFVQVDLCGMPVLHGKLLKSGVSYILWIASLVMWWAILLSCLAEMG